MPPYAADIQRCTSRRCTSSLAGAIPISQRALTETAGPYLENCLLGGCSAALARTSRQRHEWTARLGMLATSLDKGRGRRHWLGEHEKYNNAMDILEKGGGLLRYPASSTGLVPWTRKCCTLVATHVARRPEDVFGSVPCLDNSAIAPDHVACGRSLEQARCM